MDRYSVVGKSLPRIDGILKATGSAKYTIDVELPGMLYGKILRSPYAHAKILKIDTSKAEELPGVKAVVTGNDTKGIRFAFVDTPRYPADGRPLVEDKVRYVTEGVAAVAAVSEDVAEEALSLIEVKYEELPAVFDPEEAMKPGAPKIHEEIAPTGRSFWEEWGVPRSAEVQKVENNICSTASISFGDVEKGFEESDYVREDKFKTNVTDHCAMEPHGVVASFDPTGKLDIWLGHMGFAMKQYWLSRTLGIPASKVRVHRIHIGGAFGGKINLFDYEFLAAFLSRKTGRPVKIVLTREEVFASTRVRHPQVIYLKTGVKKDGTLSAVHTKVIDDTGAYRGTGPVVCYLDHAFSLPIYKTPNLKYEAYAVYTNNTIRAPMRGHGAPQIRFAVESQLDMIAEELGLDPVEVRLKNVRKKGDVLPNGDRLNSCGLTECIQKATKESNFRKKRGKKAGNRGIGMAVSAMFSGAQFYPFGTAAAVRVNEDGTATVFTGAVEFGQGSDTALAQIAAEELGMTLEDVEIISGDSELCPIDIGNWLSGGIHVSGKAVQLAAADAKRQLLEVAAEILGAKVENLQAGNRRIYVKGNHRKGIPISNAIKMSILKRNGKQITGVGHCKAHEPDVNWYPSLTTGRGRFTSAYSFSAVVAEVEVDPETGRMKLLNVVTAHDCGFPINPLLVEGQAEGQGVMGQGQALFEELITSESGEIVNPTFLDYRVPRSFDIPKFKTIHIETDDPRGPFGGKEVGEGVIGAVPAAIANAVYDAVGIRVKELPITSEKIIRVKVDNCK